MSGRLLILGLVALSALGCRNTIVSVECTDNLACDRGTICSEEGQCIIEETLGCTFDTDCNSNAGEVCDQGACIAPNINSGCINTADCAMDQYCNSSTGACSALLEGMCREAAQCGVTEPLCSASSPAVPGRCVQCLSDADCGGSRCVQPGICEGGVTDPGTSGQCPDNSSLVGEQCQCNAGFVANPAGGCVPFEDPNGGTDPAGPCPPNAGEIAPGQCQCDQGFEPSADQSTCVAIGGGTDPGPGTGPGTDPDPDPGSGSGGLDLCAVFGWYDDGVCDDPLCPQPDPDCNAPTEPTDPGPTAECSEPSDCWAANVDNTCTNGSCVCDMVWMETQCGAAGVDAAACACNASTPGIQENGSCVTDGTTLDCAEGLLCVTAGDNGAGQPTMGSCKRPCADNSECGGNNCVADFLVNGTGVCGTALSEGQAGCGFWDSSNTFCFDPGAEVQGGAFLECINGTCGLLCDSMANPNDPLTCPTSRSCSSSFQPAEGYNTDVALCE